jgi:hypothetical protein
VIFMQDKTSIPKPWCELGPITKNGGGWIVKDLLIRWNEQQETKQTDMGTQTEYVYDAYRFDYLLPVEIEPGRESVEYYLDAAKTAIVQLAQDRMAQEAGFLDTN